MADTFSVEVERIGLVELEGVGPWVVHEYGRSSYEIRDSAGRNANTKVWRPGARPGAPSHKADTNVVWAAKSTPSSIVNAANAYLGIDPK